MPPEPTAINSTALHNLRVGVGITGSFCTFDTTFAALRTLCGLPGLVLTFVLSLQVQTLRSRFGSPEETQLALSELSPHAPILDIASAEPLGPQNLLDLFMIAPCTGNTLAKLANGITDTPVLMAAKGHLRNGKPLLISLASNDALGLNLKNVGTLMNTKNIYFVPFGQDAPHKKPNSLVARQELLLPAAVAAMQGQQLQPALAL